MIVLDHILSKIVEQRKETLTDKDLETIQTKSKMF